MEPMTHYKNRGEMFTIDQFKTPISKIVMQETTYNKTPSLVYFELIFIDKNDKELEAICSHPNKEKFLRALDIRFEETKIKEIKLEKERIVGYNMVYNVMLR